MPNHSSDPSDRPNNNSQGKETSDSFKNQHNDSLVKDKNSIPKSNESGKSFSEGGSPKTIAEEVEQSTVAQRRNAQFSNLTRERDNLLSHTQDPVKRAQIESKYNSKLEAVKEQFPTQAEKAVKHEKAFKANGRRGGGCFQVLY